MRQDVWTILGIAPTTDAAEIRRAYARQLKLTRPEDDPEGFQRLFAARAAAFRMAQHLAQAQQDGAAAPVTIEVDPDDIEAPATVEIAEPTPAWDTVRQETPARISVTDAAEDDGETPPVIRELAATPLEASAGHWRKAEQLAEAFEQVVDAPGATIDLAAARHLLAATAKLPKGPREVVEASLLETLARGLRTPGHPLDELKATRIAPLLVAAEPVFGWLEDDGAFDATLDSDDAIALRSFARDLALAADPKRGGAAVGGPGVAGLSREDAHAFFSGWPSALPVYEKMRRRGRLPWRIDLSAFLMPHYWAAIGRRWELLALVLIGDWTGRRLTELAETQGRTYAICAVALYLAVHLGIGLGADRIRLWNARQAAREAGRRLLYDPQARSQWLAERGVIGSTRLQGLLWLPAIFFAIATYPGFFVALSIALG